MTRCLTDMVRIELHFLSFFSGYAEHPVESQVPSEGLNTGLLQWKNSVLTDSRSHSTADFTYYSSTAVYGVYKYNSFQKKSKAHTTFGGAIIKCIL